MSTGWDRVKSLYADYGDTIAPLIALVEVRWGFFPTPILNELRAFTTHVARIANGLVEEKDIDEQVVRASRHIVRIKLDLYKYLTTWHHDEYVDHFPKRYANVVLDDIVVDRKKFMTTYHELLAEGNRLTEEAKMLEINGPAENSMGLYFDALQAYRKLYTHVQTNMDHIIEAKRLRDSRIVRGYIIGGAVGVASSLIAACIWQLCFGS